jgi:hypothetical protein
MRNNYNSDEGLLEEMNLVVYLIKLKAFPKKKSKEFSDFDKQLITYPLFKTN